jgi:hypothetical protein
VQGEIEARGDRKARSRTLGREVSASPSTLASAPSSAPMDEGDDDAASDDEQLVKEQNSSDDESDAVSGHVADSDAEDDREDDEEQSSAMVVRARIRSTAQGVFSFGSCLLEDMIELEDTLHQCFLAGKKVRLVVCRVSEGGRERGREGGCWDAAFSSRY